MSIERDDIQDAMDKEINTYKHLAKILRNLKQEIKDDITKLATKKLPMMESNVSISHNDSSPMRCDEDITMQPLQHLDLDV